MSAAAIKDAFTHDDKYGDLVNMSHVVGDLAEAATKIANAITPRSAGPGQDAMGGHIESLTEATMGITGALCEIARSINDLAEAVRGVDKVTVYRGGEDS